MYTQSTTVTQNRVSVYVPVVTDAMCILCHVCECFIHQSSAVVKSSQVTTDKLLRFTGSQSKVLSRLAVEVRVDGEDD